MINLNNNHSILYDPNSRYNDIDNTNVIFLTPKQIKKLDIGIDPSMFREDEEDSIFPFLLDSLKEMVKESTMGEDNGSTIAMKVEGSECKAYIALDINGKMCKLQSEEWNLFNNLEGLPIHKQTKVFQRLISQGEITLEDLAAVDIDTSVYKKLVVNDMCGFHVCQEKIAELDRIADEQKNNKRFERMRKSIAKQL